MYNCDKTDFSDWCIDETLLQLMNDVWRLCVYIQRRMHLQSAIMKFMIKRCWSSYNVWKSEMQNWEVCQVFRFVQITRIWNTLWQLKSLQSDKWGGLSTVIQLLHTILVRKSEWESRCSVKTWARYVNRFLRW
jgi:hypothetical protein